MAVTAASSGIRKLYHYEVFRPEYLEDLLVNQRVHFSNPKNFNDPWDCHAWFDTMRAYDAAYRASHIKAFQVRIPSMTEAQQSCYEGRLSADGDLFKGALETFAEITHDALAERWRIYCLTPHPDNLRMWSHYSDKHRGVCLEFDASIALIGNAYRVNYCDVLQTLDVLEITREDAFRVLINKSTEWSYENEYGILARDRAADKVTPQFMPITDREFLLLPPLALTSIIAGCRADFDEIKSLVEKHAPGLSVRRAVQAPDRYSLIIVG